MYMVGSNILNVSLTSMIILGSFGFTSTKKTDTEIDTVTATVDDCSDSPMVTVITEQEYKQQESMLYLGNSFVGFKEALAFKESQGNYFKVNTLGYLGKYQFGASTLELLGVYNPSYFLNNPTLQERAFIANLERNKWILRREILLYQNRWVGGVLVTESGILAAAHLAGPGGIQKFLRSGGTFNKADAYGTSIGKYLRKFSGYDTSSIKSIKNAKV